MTCRANLAAALLLALALPAGVLHAEDEPKGDPKPVEDPAKAAEREADLTRARKLNGEVGRLYRQGRLLKALEAARESLRLREKHLPPNHGEISTALNNVATMLSQVGRPREALPLFERSLAIRKAMFGTEDHPRIAVLYSNLAGMHLDLGEKDKALERAKRAVEILVTLGKTGTPAYAQYLIVLGRAHWAQGDAQRGNARYQEAIGLLEQAGPKSAGTLGAALNAYGRQLIRQRALVKAEDVLRRACELRLRRFGEKHPVTAESIAEHARVFNAMQRYDEAIARYRTAVRIMQQSVGARHPKTIAVMSNFALILTQLGRNAEARGLYEKLIPAMKDNNQVPADSRAAVLGNHALLLENLGRITQARESHEQALALLEGLQAQAEKAGRARVGSRLSSQVGTVLQNYAQLNMRQGQLGDAERLLQRALALRERHQGPESREAAFTVNALAGLRYTQARFKQAMELSARALAIRRKAKGTSPRELWQSLSNVGSLHTELGAHAEAEAHLREARALLAEHAGVGHPQVLDVDIRLADLQRRLGRHEDAEATLRAVLKRLGDSDASGRSYVARAMSQLALVLEDLGRLDEAEAAHRRALEEVVVIVRRQLGGLLGARRRALVSTSRRYLGRLVAFSLRHGRPNYDSLLRFKGLAARAEQLERELLRTASPDVRARLARLREAEQQVARLASNVPFGAKPREGWRTKFTQASAERERLAEALARELETLRASAKVLELGVDDIRRHIPEGAVLVDTLSTVHGHAAWIVRPKGPVEILSLGAQAEVDKAIGSLIEASTSDDVVSAADAAWQKAAHAVADPVLAPLLGRLPKETTALILCPDAALALVPWGALPVSDKGEALFDRMRVVSLSFAQDLVPPATPVPAGDGAFVVGGVDYTQASEDPAEVRGAGTGGTTRALRGRRFIYLEATKHEAESLVKRFGQGTRFVTGADATEGRLRAFAPGRKLLHLATHGFVTENQRRGLVRSRAEQGTWLGAARERQLSAHDPMALTGLALAGANEKKDVNGDDGILTALEASMLDLRAAELVVLSACDTARGRIPSGEGVIGLVRGFTLAGARNVVASLWKVDDTATGRLMEFFYDELAKAKGVPPAEALRRAALRLRDVTVDGKQPFAAPRHWAAFVAYGR